jgi:putative transposase
MIVKIKRSNKMAHEVDDSVLSQVYEVLVDSGFDGLVEALTLLLNEVMLLERSQHLQAQPYERSAQRRGYANGYKPKRVRTRIGELTLAVPQVRDGDFYPSSLEKGLRSERALWRTNSLGSLLRKPKLFHVC